MSAFISRAKIQIFQVTFFFLKRYPFLNLTSDFDFVAA